METTINVENMSNVQAINIYFGKISMSELKALSAEEREELGQLAKAELARQAAVV